MAFPDLPAITAVAAVSVAAPPAAISAQHDGAQRRARHYARTARSGKPVADAATSADTSHISIEGLKAELQALLGDIRALADADTIDAQTANRLLVLSSQAATIKAEIAEAVSATDTSLKVRGDSR